MRRKIFKKSDESRIRSDLKFKPYFWRLRSADSDDSTCVSYVSYLGFAHKSFAYYDNGVLPVCTI